MRTFIWNPEYSKEYSKENIKIARILKSLFVDCKPINRNKGYENKCLIGDMKTNA